MLYSYKKQFPTELPFSLILENGLTLTEVNTFSDERLKELGFDGPYQIPDYDEIRQKFVWTGDKFLVENISDDEIKQNIKNDKNNYIKFYELFYESDLCKNIEEKNQSNIILENKYLEFKLLEKRIKYNFDINFNFYAEFSNIMRIFYNSYNISNELKLFLDDLLIQCNFDFLIEECKFDRNYYPSWILQKDGTSMLPPTNPPDTENIYIWDEEAYQLDNTNGWKLSN